MRPRPGTPHPSRAAFLTFIVVLVVLAGLPAVSGASVPSAAPSAGFLVPAEGIPVYSGSFAERAGYGSADASSVTDVAPATSSQLVVVTFYPSDPSFFSPPPAGTQPLTLAEIADRYGLSASDYTSAESYFESTGLSVVHASPDRLSMTVEGTPAALDRAFGTSLESGTYEGRSVTFPSTQPSLPGPLESMVSSVTGLASGFDTFALPAGVPAATPGVSLNPAQAPDLITPAIAREIYDLSSLYNVSGSMRTAVGQGIVLLLWGDGYSPNDISAFFSNDYPSSFPQPDIQYFPVDGAPNPAPNAVNDPSKAPQELTLDMEWAGSMAPGATLDAVYAPDGPQSAGYSPTDASMFDALNTAVTGIAGVSVISMSFGTPENESGALQAAWATDLATAAQEGITLLAATGDLGGDAQANCQGGPSMDYPASSPAVIAVGGTDPVLARNLLGQVTGLSSESAWDRSGGGYSRVFTAPSWEEVGNAGTSILANGGWRATPDVAAAGTYNYLYYDGQAGTAAGTSFATPFWAGLVTEMDALYGSKLGFLTPRIYAVGAGQEIGKTAIGLGNVTGGTTCIGTAGPGWNTETGWGSPRALLLYEDLTATFVNLTVSGSPSPVAPGGTVTLTAEIANRTNGKPLSGVPITVSLAASDPNGPCAGVWGTESLTSNASGAVTLAVTVPACFFGSHGTAEATVTSDGYYGTSSSTVDVNLLGFVPALAGIEQFPLNVVAFGLIMGLAVVVGYALGRRGPTPRPPTQRVAPSMPPSPPVQSTGTPTTSSLPPAPPAPTSPQNPPAPPAP